MLTLGSLVPGRTQSPSPCASHAGAKAMAAPALMPWGGDSRLVGRDSWSQSLGGSIWPVPAPTCPHHLPQEHKAEVKASMTARFPAVGARALTHGTWHGSSAQTWGHAHQLGETGHTEPGPHPQLVVCSSVHLTVRTQGNPGAGCLWARAGLPAEESASPSYKLLAGP